MESLDHFGFLTVLQETSGFVGGYLVTNRWGRPLEFRLTTSVQPNRIQQILYGKGLLSFICGELIGKTLVEKANTSSPLIFTDLAAVLDLRRKISSVVVLVEAIQDASLQTEGGEEDASTSNRPMDASLTLNQSRLSFHTAFPDDRAWLEAHQDALFDLDFSERFQRIRDALLEARKLGATHRAA